MVLWTKRPAAMQHQHVKGHHNYTGRSRRLMHMCTQTVIPILKFLLHLKLYQGPQRWGSEVRQG